VAVSVGSDGYRGAVTAPDRPVIALSVLSLIEGVALLGYALFDVIEAVRIGITGPEEVSNPAALTLLVVITAAFGAGMVWVAYGWWRTLRWARAPFILAQALVVLIGYELAQSEGAVERTVGIAGAGLAVLGLVLVFSPGVTRRLDEAEFGQSE
jgi:hypothetical protein